MAAARAEAALEAAARLKEEGNAAFRAGDPRKAAARYVKVFAYAGLRSGGLPGMAQLMAQGRAAPAGPSPEVQAQLDDLRVGAKLNLAQCYLKLREWERAERFASQALEERPDHAKALFRRGLARLELGRVDGAAADLGRAEELAPGDAAVARARARVAKAERAQELKLRKAFSGAFDRM